MLTQLVHDPFARLICERMVCSIQAEENVQLSSLCLTAY